MSTILCVDDHHATLRSLSLILQLEGYCCVKAENAEQAERAFIENAIDLVILDYGLPDMNGSELASRLKSIRPVKIVMLSGNPSLNAKPDSVNVLLPKPQHPTGLLTAISRLLCFSETLVV